MSPNADCVRQIVFWTETCTIDGGGGQKRVMIANSSIVGFKSVPQRFPRTMQTRIVHGLDAMAKPIGVYVLVLFIPLVVWSQRSPGHRAKK